MSSSALIHCAAFIRPGMMRKATNSVKEATPIDSLLPSCAILQHTMRLPSVSVSTTSGMYIFASITLRVYNKYSAMYHHMSACVSHRSLPLISLASHPIDVVKYNLHTSVHCTHFRMMLQRSRSPDNSYVQVEQTCLYSEEAHLFRLFPPHIHRATRSEQHVDRFLNRIDP